MGTAGDYRDWDSIISEEEWLMVAQRMGVPPRQMDIVRAYVFGDRKPQAIAQRLGLRISTVKTHIQRLYGNVGAHDQGDVIALALRELLKLRPPRRG